VQKETGIALGRILLIMNVVTEEQLVEVMRWKVEQEVLRIFRSGVGRFVFVDETVRALQLVPLRIDVGPLISFALHGKREVAVVAETVESSEESESMDDTQRVLFGSRARAAEEADASDVKEEAAPPPLVPVEEEIAPVVPTASPIAAAIVPAADAPESGGDVPVVEPGASEEVVVSKSAKGKSKKYHRPDCVTALRVAAQQRTSYGSPAAAEAAGFERCKVCFRA
jgi:hypothetical protein